ncbi:MAG: hypothetical protein AABW59_00125 [archaeon]
MNLCKIILALFCLTVFSISAFAAECDLNTVEVSNFDLVFKVLGDSTADVIIRLTTPFAESCLSALGVPKNSYSNFDCSKEVLYAQDAMFKGMGFYTLNKGSCVLSYFDGILSMEFKAKTDMVVAKISGESYELTFREWDFVDSKSKSSLTIILPPGAKLISFYPIADPEGKPDYEKNIIYWSSIPQKGKIPSVKYSYSSQNYILILVAILIILAIVGGVGALFLIKNSKNAVSIKKIQGLKSKMALLEKDYLLGKMDETTYRRLIEQYQLQLNEFKSALPKQKDKRKVLEKIKI